MLKQLRLTLCIKIVVVALLLKLLIKQADSFDWGLIINGTSGYNFVTGTVYNQYGNVEVVS